MIITILLKQIIIMFLLIGVGFVLYKKGYISEQGSKDLGAILLRVVIPCVIIKSYMAEFSTEKLKELGISALLALLSLVIAMVVSYFVFGRRKPIANFAASFCNAGFIGIPLVQAVFGDQSVFYIAAYITLLNIFQWTYGALVMTGNKEVIKIKTILLNPVLIGVVIGILIFISQLPVHETITKTVGYIANMNTPIAMLILGVYLGKTDIKSIFIDLSIYPCVLLRLLIIPAITLVIFKFIPVVNEEIVMVALIAACTPVGANIAIFAQQFGKDYLLSVKTVCLSTILSIITIPIFFSVVQMVY